MSTLPHPSHRIARLKLIKDLKYGKIHLRQSLLQMSQFEDIDKIFKHRKQIYQIEDLENVHIQKIQPQELQEQVNLLISPIERMELFRKEKINKKLKEKMINSMSKQIPTNKPRVPKTSKMLKKFQEKYRNQMPVSYKQQLRQSQLNLQKIKRNDKTRFQSSIQTQKKMYQSRLFILSEESSAQKTNSRKRFVSLKTSLPEKQKFVYESIRQIMKGKQNQYMKGPAIDIKSIQNCLDNYLNDSFKRMKIRIQKDPDFRNTANSPLKIRQRASSRQNKHHKIKSNVQRSFTRSQQSSKNMIETMSSFYETKRQKKQNFDKMVTNLKYDRPLTSSIRRKNYTVLGKQTLSPITDYRDLSEQERIKIRSKNHSFYCKLIQGLDVYHEQDIPTTVYIVEQVKRIFQTQYALTQQIFQELIDSINTMEIDQKTEDILNELGTFLGVSLIFKSHSTFIK